MEGEEFAIDPIGDGKFELYMKGRNITIEFYSRSDAEDFLIKLLTTNNNQ